MENFWKCLNLHAVTQNTDEIIIKRGSILKILFLTPPILNGISALSLPGAKMGLKADLRYFNTLQTSDCKKPH